MNKTLKFSIFLLAANSFLAVSFFLKAQTLSTDPKTDVMLQGFYWDSYKNADIIAESGLYNYLKARVDQYSAAGFNVIWTPPASHGNGMGYYPKDLYNFKSEHGSEEDIKGMLKAFRAKGIHGMADVVANHRNGTTAWADFTNPAWGCEAITEDDEVKGVAGQVQPCSGAYDEGETESGSRDMNHKSLTVQNGYRAYLSKLKDLGFDSWRWDKAKGFPGKYNGEYNASSSPYFSVGEYLDGDVDKVKNWVNATGNSFVGKTKKSAGFDFPLYFKLVNAVNNNRWSDLNNGGSMPGLVGTYGYSDYAVTFVGNHDTNRPDGSISKLVGNDNIMKGTAYILTHPGIPMVFLPFYEANQQKTNELIAIRKQNGINAWSKINITNSASFYSAIIDGKVAVKIGSGNWAPPAGAGWILNTYGNDYAVWSKIKVKTLPITPADPVKITLVGPAVGGWTTDVEMSSEDGVNFIIQDRSLSIGSVKFRSNHSWTSNWGSKNFPRGTGNLGGAEIPIKEEKHYKITFNIKTGEYFFDFKVGIELFAAHDRHLKVFPNPAENSINVSSGYEIKQIQLFDVFGKMIQSNTYANNSQVMLNLTDLSAGLYFVRITTNNSMDTVKINKE
jgi:hypothetical protein